MASPRCFLLRDSHMQLNSMPEDHSLHFKPRFSSQYPLTRTLISPISTCVPLPSRALPFATCGPERTLLTCIKTLLFSFSSFLFNLALPPTRDIGNCLHLFSRSRSVFAFVIPPAAPLVCLYIPSILTRLRIRLVSLSLFVAFLSAHVLSLAHPLSSFLFCLFPSGRYLFSTRLTIHAIQSETISLILRHIFPDGA